MSTGCYGVKLRSVRFGGKRFTTEQWISEFVAAVQKGDSISRNEHLEANAALDAMGV
jgi:hypothetical protein